MSPTRARYSFWLLHRPVAIFAFIVISLAIATTSVLADSTRITAGGNHLAHQLLFMDDEELLSIISKKAFDYFWHEANPHNGLIPHSDAENSPCSIAAVGLGLSAIPIGIERGWIGREEGYDRIAITLSTLSSDRIQRTNGFFYQLLDMDEGIRFQESKVSSMDTCILIAGALFAGEFFSQTAVQDLAYELYSAVNWQWMMNHGETLARNWTPESGFEDARWDSFDESMLMYILAMGSPTYPVPASTWHRIRRPVRGNYIFVPQESLTSYILPHLWLDLKAKEDYYANYWNNVVSATRYNRIYSMLRSCEFKTHTRDLWGLSPCEGPKGYQVYGASADCYHGVFAPHASIGCIPFSPYASMQAAREMLKKYGDRIWGKYGFSSGFTADGKWWSESYHGISAGLILLMIENYRTGLVWKYVTCNEHIQAGLNRAEFCRSELHQAVTPVYLGEVKDKHYSWGFPATD